jgi:hypothetical protein
MATAIFNALKFIPASMAVKALSKVDKRFNNFFANAAAYGYDINNALDFISKKFSDESEREKLERKNNPTAEEGIALQQMNKGRMPIEALKGAASFALGGLVGSGQEEPTNNQNQESISQPEQQQQISPQTPPPFAEFLRQNPELGAYLDKQMKAGRDPIVAATQAKKISKFRSLISQLEEDMGQSFEDLIGYLFYGRQRQETGMKPPQDKGQMPSSGDADILNLMSNILKM